jgi:hypothetical protein
VGQHQRMAGLQGQGAGVLCSTREENIDSCQLYSLVLQIQGISAKLCMSIRRTYTKLLVIRSSFPTFDKLRSASFRILDHYYIAVPSFKPIPS